MNHATISHPDKFCRWFTNLFAFALLLNGAQSLSKAASASLADEVGSVQTVETVRVKASIILDQAQQTLTSPLPLSSYLSYSNESLTPHSLAGTVPVDDSGLLAAVRQPPGVFHPSGYEIQLAATQSAGLGDTIESTYSMMATITGSNLEDTPLSLSDVELPEEGRLPLVLILTGFPGLDDPTGRSGLPERSWASPAFIQ